MFFFTQTFHQYLGAFAKFQNSENISKVNLVEQIRSDDVRHIIEFFGNLGEVCVLYIASLRELKTWSNGIKWE
jgi:hypothetical protein